MSRLVAAGVLAAIVLGCSPRPRPLPGNACLYVRPRLVRLDKAVAALDTEPAAGAHDITAVAGDMHDFTAQLPGGGKAKADRPLVVFSRALDTYAAGVGASPPPPSMANAERALKHTCGVAPAA